MALLLFSGLLLLIYITFFLYYRSCWRSVPSFKKDPLQQPKVFITVIIPARNEERNLPALLQGLKNQSYPARNFEVIVVDDHSTDRTSSLVKEYPMVNIKLIRMSEFVTTNINSYKKKAIELAVSNSHGELIVTTDADCTVPPGWLQNIAAFYEERKPAFIVMPVAMMPGNNMLDIFQALDFMTMQGITGAAVHRKFHNMCNGANLAYTKKAFEVVEGFKGIDDIASGDDMLLMHKINGQFPDDIKYLRSGEVTVQTRPEKTVGNFISQRIRWASKADKYDDKKITAVLVVVYLFNLLLFFLPLLAIFKNYRITVLNCHYTIFDLWVWLLLCKTIVELYFLFPVAKFFNKQNLLYVFPLLQPFHILYIVIAGWMGKFGSYKWKERKVK